MALCCAALIHILIHFTVKEKGCQIFISEKLGGLTLGRAKYLAAFFRTARRVQAATILISPSEKDDEHMAWIDAFLNQRTLP